MFVTIIKLSKNTNIEELEKVANDIKNKDETFMFKITSTTFEIFSEDKDKAYKRGIWLIKKVPTLKNCKFDVKVKK
jgi:hypothetical protein